MRHGVTMTRVLCCESKVVVLREDDLHSYTFGGLTTARHVDKIEKLQRKIQLLESKLKESEEMFQASRGVLDDVQRYSRRVELRSAEMELRAYRYVHANKWLQQSYLLCHCGYSVIADQS